MYKRESTTLQSKYFKRLIPAGIVIVLANVMWKNFIQIEIALSDIIHAGLWVLTVILALTLANLYCEMRKWATLVNSDLLKHSTAFKAVVYGICAGFLTPNRLGEFAGRALPLPKQIQTKASLMTFVGSGIQGTVTACAGLVGVLFYPILPELPTVKGLSLQFLVPVAGAIAAGGVLLVKNPLQRKLKKAIGHIKTLRASLLVKAACWALVRYIIFASQFVIALYGMGYQGDILTCYAGIFLVYFIQSFIPFTAMGELGVRELLAVLILGNFFATPILAAAASFVVWVANVGTPVLIGAIHFRFFRPKKIVHG